MKYFFLAFLLISNAVFAVNYTLRPDADLVTNSWTTTPLWSKINDSVDALDGVVITSPLTPGALDAINFSLTEIDSDQGDEVTIMIVARKSAGGASSVSLLLEWFNETGDQIASIDTGPLSSTETLYSDTFSLSALPKSDINRSFITITPSSTVIVAQPRATINAINLNISASSSSGTLRANGTIIGPLTNLTGESFTFRGSCEAFGTVNGVHFILQNSTDNVTFTTITTTSTQPIYANVSSYSFGTLTNANSSSPSFSVTATKVGNYSLRAQCNSTDAGFINTSSANFTANQAYGILNVTLTTPPPSAATTNVAQNSTFLINATVTCASTNPTAICSVVNGTARYNFSSISPNITVNTTFGEVPFWIVSSYFRPSRNTTATSGVGSAVNNPQNVYDAGFNDTTTFAEVLSVATGFAEVNYTFDITKYYNLTAVLYITTARDVVLSPGDISIYNFTSGQFVLWFSPTFTSATTNFTTVSASSGYLNSTGHAMIRVRSDDIVVSERILVYDTHVKAPNTKECGSLDGGVFCVLTWLLNATGKIATTWGLDAVFNSSNTNIAGNDTSNSNVTIGDCLLDFTVHWSLINFSSQIPNTNQNPASGNAGAAYNTSVNSGGCATDLYIKGSNLTGPGTYIGVGNITWSNVSNTYSTSINLTGVSVPIRLNITPIVNTTTWYWINAPPTWHGVYNGTITITGVKNGDSP